MIFHKPKLSSSNTEGVSNIFARARIYTLARHALYSYLESIDVRRVWLPSYCAEGAFLPYKELGFDINFYEVDDKLQIIPDSLKYFEKPSILHYIHHFGLFIPENIEFLDSLSNKELIIIDDRSLTLPIKPYQQSYDAELYSIYKLAGVPFGGSLLKNIPEPNTTNYPQYLSDLELSMLKHSEYYSRGLHNRVPMSVYKLYIKLFAGKYNYSDKLNQSIKNTLKLVPDNFHEQIVKLDIAQIHAKRIANTKYYYDNLDLKYLIKIDKASFISQALIGFPIKTINPDIFHNYMVKNGILGFSLKTSWWMNTNKQPCGLHGSHYCLPVSQDLSLQDLNRIVDVVNNY